MPHSKFPGIDAMTAYQPADRTRWQRLVDRFKPRSAATRTTLLVVLVMIFSLGMSLWFFWRTLYLPEVDQHARYLASEIDLLRADQTHPPYSVQQTLPEPLRQRLVIELVNDPALFPHFQNKRIAELFTRQLAKQLAQQLQVSPQQVQIFFQFKPVPQLWIHVPHFPQSWLREPLPAYANYSLELILGWLLGTPLLTSIIILTLVRQLNRPLRRLQYAANSYSKTGSAPYLATTHGPLEIRQVNASFNHMVSTLQQIEQDRQVMLAGISHDLRTPLTRVRLTAEMLPDDFLREGLIYDVDDMDAILNQFISYMRDGSDEPVQPTQINDLLNEIMIQFKPLDIRFEPVELPIIRARTLSLKRLIANLVTNANRYGTPPIELSARQQDQELLISVRDHGEGIAAHEIKTLMQPFVRGDSARTVQGSGLGLAIVKRIVDIHNGRMEVANHPDGGLLVQIFLPLNA